MRRVVGPAGRREQRGGSGDGGERFRLKPATGRCRCDLGEEPLQMHLPTGLLAGRQQPMSTVPAVPGAAWLRAGWGLSGCRALGATLAGAVFGGGQTGGEHLLVADRQVASAAVTGGHGLVGDQVREAVRVGDGEQALGGTQGAPSVRPRRCRPRLFGRGFSSATTSRATK